jgi:hypothetical protein
VQQKLLILAAFLAAMPNLALARPLIMPNRDVVVEYHARGMVPGPSGALTTTVMVRFAGSGDRLRVDGPDGGFYALVDVENGRLIMVMPDSRIYVDQPADPDLIALLQADDSSFQRTGSTRVAGYRCTTYAADINGHSGRLCLTDDGILLQAHIDSPDRHPELEAVTITYADQPSDMFEVPEGFHRVNLPRPPRHGLGLGPLDNTARDNGSFGRVGR